MDFTQLPPLPERLRPTNLEEYIGQKHIIGVGAPLYEMIESGLLRSFILWGPPGVGKTTLAEIVAKVLDLPLYRLSAVSAGVKEVREIIERAEETSRSLFGAQSHKTPILFIDEIHRFSKSQQDSLLHAVERGSITLIGATTENPSFEVIRPLLSRARIFVLKSLEKEDLQRLLDRAITTDVVLKSFSFKVKEVEALFVASGGDARKLLNILEYLTSSAKARGEAIVQIDNEMVAHYLQQNPAVYDKGGEMHYDIISAFIKSVRGSDPNAALYWLARMIEGGEDPKFIARRLAILAAEDIGLANPNALLIADAVFSTLERIGWPEGRIPLAEATIYLAMSPKSNSAYMAINQALDFVRKAPPYPVPMHLRNAPTDLMDELGYGAGYIYPHNYPGHFAPQDYLPKEIAETCFWTPADNLHEQRLIAQMEEIKHQGRGKSSNPLK